MLPFLTIVKREVRGDFALRRVAGEDEAASSMKRHRRAAQPNFWLTRSCDLGAPGGASFCMARKRGTHTYP